MKSWGYSITNKAMPNLLYGEMVESSGGRLKQQSANTL